MRFNDPEASIFLFIVKDWVMIAHFALQCVDRKEVGPLTKNTLYCSGYKKTEKKLEILFNPYRTNVENRVSS